MTFRKAISTLWILPIIMVVALLCSVYDVTTFNFSEFKSGRIALFIVYFFWPLLGFLIGALSIISISEYYILEGEGKDISQLLNAILIGFMGGVVVILLSAFYFGFSLSGQFYFITILMIGQLIRFLVLKRNFKSQTSNLE